MFFVGSVTVATHIMHKTTLNNFFPHMKAIASVMKRKIE